MTADFLADWDALERSSSARIPSEVRHRVEDEWQSTGGIGNFRAFALRRSVEIAKSIVAEAKPELPEADQPTHLVMRQGREWTSEQRKHMARQSIERAARRYGWSEERLAERLAKFDAEPVMEEEPPRGEPKGRRPRHAIPAEMQESIRGLDRQGYSQRQIAQELGISKITVRKYLVSETARREDEEATMPAETPALPEPASHALTAEVGGESEDRAACSLGPVPSDDAQIEEQAAFQDALLRELVEEDIRCLDELQQILNTKLQWATKALAAGRAFYKQRWGEGCMPERRYIARETLR